MFFILKPRNYNFCEPAWLDEVNLSRQASVVSVCSVCNLGRARERGTIFYLFNIDYIYRITNLAMP